MKKVLLVLITLFILIGCGSKDIKDVVNKGIEDYKQTTDSNIKEFINESDITADYTYTFIKTLFDFDYEIKDININGDNATVMVIIKTINLTEYISEISKDSEILSLSEKLSLATDEETAKEYVNKLVQRINTIAKNYPKVNETTIEVPCVKENGNWVIDSTYDINKNILDIFKATDLIIGE